MASLKVIPAPLDVPVAPPVRRPDPLLRELLGETLRSARQRQGRTLKEVATEAGVSITYLSEVERGHKEASSEVVGAVTRALGGSLVDLLTDMTVRVVPPLDTVAGGAEGLHAVA
ncbi:helix-turn-helix domain-containing protein [Williamsia sterculiae]|uniref:Helix-turn-helix domain-containing protein n=1 Tax=Williamsia sterculiae TaxID=1344003 RepID=A0A1N7HD06_9NOCA|nr:helix-turn-helix transcriptional regulator [Williamsia sterculiae]SIS22767.1 Helix-turn-helix domain-containing protein [Williamsia sterculiae]